MQAPDPVEAALARLMPPALRQDYQSEIEAMIDELAGADTETVTNISSGKWLARCLIGGGIAAGIGALFAVFPMKAPRDSHVGQMLVDEAQLADALRLSKPGEEIVISGTRGGKPTAVKLKLGDAPPLRKPLSGEMAEISAVPLRIVNIAEKTASFSDEDGSGVVRRDGETYNVKISGAEDELVFEGQLPKDETFDQLPEAWRPKIQMLRLTLDQALDRGTAAQRQPQPRLAPPATAKP